ncbi:MAG: hypothetical protein GXO12_00480 [Epsilonproteobacteria bacterium]|nr:hypothetical protein [Campylobacterota bacterium]
MKKFFAIVFLSVLLFATDYGAMSTQELLAIMNYTIVKKDQKAILDELKSREKEMSAKEKKEYLKNLQILKKQNAKK